MLSEIDWNQPYKNRRDFKWVSTSDSERLCLLAKDAHPTNDKLTFLDIGCGTGQLVRDMFHRGFTSTGIDTSTEAIAIATKSSALIGNGINFSVSSALEPFDRVYDLIVCKYVIAFLDNRSTLYGHIKNAMKPTSTFVIITPQKELLPPNKQSIAIDDAILMPELQNYFTVVNRIASGEDWWYVCQK